MVVLSPPILIFGFCGLVGCFGFSAPNSLGHSMGVLIIFLGDGGETKRDGGEGALTRLG